MPGGFQCRRAYARSKVPTPTPNLVFLAKTRQNNYRTLRITKIQAVRRGVYQERICALETHAPIRDTVVPVRQFHWELSEPRRKDPSYVRLIIPGG